VTVREKKLLIKQHFTPANHNKMAMSKA